MAKTTENPALAALNLFLHRNRKKSGYINRREQCSYGYREFLESVRSSRILTPAGKQKNKKYISYLFKILITHFVHRKSSDSARFRFLIG